MSERLKSTINAGLVGLAKWSVPFLIAAVAYWFGFREKTESRFVTIENSMVTKEQHVADINAATAKISATETSVKVLENESANIRVQLNALDTRTQAIQQSAARVEGAVGRIEAQLDK